MLNDSDEKTEEKIKKLKQRTMKMKDKNEEQDLDKNTDVKENRLEEDIEDVSNLKERLKEFKKRKS